MNGLIAPAYFRYVDQSFNTRCDLQECSVVFYIDNLAFDYAAFLDRITNDIPWMWLQLFETKRDSLLVFIKIKYHDVDFLIDLKNFRRMVDPAPADISDVE